jgi:hypothetical protein
MRKQSFRNYILIGNRTQDTSPTGIPERIGILFPGLLFTLPVGFGVRQLLLLRGKSVSLYENGLVYRTYVKAFSTTWDEIEAYNKESAFRITKKDGQVIEFGLSIDGADEVQEQTLSRMLPRVKAATWLVLRLNSKACRFSVANRLVNS